MPFRLSLPLSTLPQAAPRCRPCASPFQSSLAPRRFLSSSRGAGDGDDSSGAEDLVFGRIPPTPNEKLDALGRRLLRPADIRALNESARPLSTLTPPSKPDRQASKPQARAIRDLSRGLSSSQTPPPTPPSDPPGAIPKSLLTPTRSTDPKLTSDDLFGARSGVYDVLLKNRKWADTERERNPDFFKPLSVGQSPKYFAICCSDSRCPSEMMMGFAPGECFTVRNIAASVMIGDLAMLTATQYAVDVLKVSNILIVGHRDCGGIKAAMSRQSFGTTIDAWVRHVRDVYRQHIVELDAYEDPQEKLNRLIERHVIEQCVNVFKMGFVQRARRNSRIDGLPFMLPQIHGLVYDPSTGYLTELDIQLREKAREYGRVYDVLA